MATTWRERARAQRPEARIVTTAAGRMIAYCGAESSLKILEGCPGAQYVAARQLKLAGQTPEATAWLLLPCDRTGGLLVETAGKVFRASDDYVAARRELLAANMEAAAFYPPPPEGLPNPFPHQVECFSETLIAFRDGKAGYGTFLDMGLGKTKLACDLSNAIRPTVCLILIQKITKDQWISAIRSAFPDAELIPLLGTIKSREEAIRALASRLEKGEQERPAVLLLNWDVLYRLEKPLLKLEGWLDLVIADEVTRICNRASQVSKAARKVAHAARWRVPMTGTPMTGDPGSLWAIYNFIDPTIFNLSYWDFMKRYCRLGGFTGWEFEGLREERVPELVEKMYANAYRQTKATVTDMPEKTYQVVELDMKREQREHYQRVAKEYGTTVELVKDGVVATGELTVASAIARTTRLQQIAAGTVPLTTLTIGEGEAQEVFGGGHREVESAKTAWVVEYCREQVETSDARGVVWVKFQAEADRVARELVAAGVKTAVIDGRTKEKDRARVLEEFKDLASDLRWLVINISAGAYGLDLPVADVMLMHSSTWNILERLQLEDRGHRIGRVRPYLVIDLILRGTIDAEIHKAYLKRMDLIQTLVHKGIAA